MGLQPGQLRIRAGDH